MTFININGTRIKVATIVQYQEARNASGGYFIDLTLVLGQSISGVTIPVGDLAAQTAALQQLDSSVAAFVEGPIVYEINRAQQYVALPHFASSSAHQQA